MKSPGEDLWDAWQRAQAKVERSLEGSVKAASGLSLASFYTLGQLNSVDFPIKMTNLAAGTTFSRERVSRVVDELVRAGLAQRQIDLNGDGRNRLAAITRDGRIRYERAAQAHQAALQREIYDSLSSAQLREFADGFGAILRGKLPNAQ